MKQSQSLDYGLLLIVHIDVIWFCVRGCFVFVALYHAQPNVTLIPGAVGHHKDGQHGQAWCVSWRPDDGHSQVAAGFSDGLLALWFQTLHCLAITLVIYVYRECWYMAY